MRPRPTLTLHINGQALSYPVIEEWVSLGIGASILPLTKLGRAERSQRLLRDQRRPALLDYEWIWITSTQHPTHVEAFFDYLRTTAPTLIAGQAC